MSRLSLTTVLKKLEDEFEDAEASYNADEQEAVQEEGEIVQSGCHSSETIADLEDFGLPLLESSILDTSEPVSEELITSNIETNLGESSTIKIDASEEDRKDKEAIDDFVKRTCLCKGGPQKKPCSTQFSTEVIQQYRENCQELTTSQLDLVIMAQLSACRTHKNCIPSSYKGNVSSFRPHSSFLFHGIKICQEIFYFLHTMSHCKLETLCSHVDEFGLSERQHGNSSRLPHNAYSLPVIEHLVSFIDNTTEAHAMPLPG